MADWSIQQIFYWILVIIVISSVIVFLIKKCQKLRRWNFDKHLTDADVEALANKLKTNKFCKSLNLQRNTITRCGASYLVDMLQVNNTLEELWLGWNQIGDNGACKICETLKHKNKTLKYLELRNNGITDQSVHTIIEMIQKNRSLECLYLENNPISKANQEKIQHAAWARAPPMSVTIY